MNKKKPTMGISIDFFDTLVEIDKDSPTITDTLTQLGYPCSKQLEGIWNSPGFDGMETYTSNFHEYTDWRKENLRNLAILCGVPSADAGKVSESLYQSDQIWTVKSKPYSKNLIELLLSKGIPLCILTNWDYSLDAYLKMAGLDIYDIPIISSAVYGVRKPNIRLFTLAREILSIKSSQHIHIGDSWNCDVAGAVRSGAKAIWLTEQPGLYVEVEPITIATPSNLLELIASLTSGM